jgi:MFS family permease
MNAQPETQVMSASPALRYSWYVVGVLALASMLGYVDRMILNLLVEPIKADLGIDDVSISLLQGVAFAVFFALAGVPIARWADRHDRCRLIAIGVALWSAMTVCCGLATSFWQLFLARVGVGIGEAALVPATFSLLVDLFPRPLLARANSVFLLGAAAGAGGALLAGAQLLEWLAGTQIPVLALLDDWQVTFVVVGLPGLLLALVLFATVREPSHRTAQTVPRATLTELVQFVSTQRSTFLTLLIAFPLAGAASQGWLAWIPSYLIRSFQVSPATAANWFGVSIMTVGIAGTVLGGVLADRRIARGEASQLLRLAIVCIAGFALAGVLGPLSGSVAGALAGLAAFIFFGSMLAVLPLLTLQLLTPAHLRAQVIAYYLLLATIVSAGLGPTVVAATTEHVLTGPADVGLALALVAALLGGIATLVLIAGRHAIDRSLLAGAPAKG